MKNLKINKIKQEITSDRNSGIELLRILTMFLIVVIHCCRIFHIDKYPNALEYFIARISLGEIGNCIFVLISNYYLLNSNKVKIKKILNIAIDQIIISILVMLLTIFVFKKTIPLSEIRREILALFYRKNWFVTEWILYYFMHPLVNIIVNKLDKKSYQKLIIFIFVFFGIFPMIPEFYAPYNNTYISFIALHLVMGYVVKFKKEYFSEKYSKIKYVFLSIFIYIFSGYCFFLFSHFTGLDFWCRWHHLTYPLLWYMCFTIFNYFLHLKLKSNIINTIGSVTLLIYLIHENYYFKRYAGEIFIGKFETWSIYKRYGASICCGIVYFIIALLIALLYKVLKSKICRLIDKNRS